MDEIITTYKPEISSSDAVHTNMENYATHMVLEAFPNLIDGLKLVQRRIIWTLGIEDDKVKCAALVGEVMKLYHPHGDNSIYEAIVRLCQPFNQTQPLVTGFGNIGAYGGGRAAASRYLDVSSSEFTRDVFFKHTNGRTLTYVPTEIGKGVEPAYFVPAIPMTLLSGAYGIGIGFKAMLNHSNLIDVCNLAIKYIENKNKFKADYKTRFKEYAKYLLPDFPTPGMLLNEEDLLRNYQNGSFNVPTITCGTLEIYPNKINIRSIPFGTGFEDIVTKNLGSQITKASFISSNFNEVIEMTTGKTHGDVELVLKRGIDPFDTLATLKKMVKFTQSRSPIWNFSDYHGNLVSPSPVELLEIWYVARVRSILSDLKLTNNDLFKQYRQYSALVTIADHTDAVLKIFKDAATKEDTLLPLQQQFDLTKFQAEYLGTLPIQQITKQGKSELLAKLQVIKDKIQKLQHMFGKLDQIIIEQIIAIRDKYKSKAIRRTTIPNFIGALQIVNSGFVQFSSIEELGHLLKRWNGSDVKIIMYPSKKHTLYLWDKNNYTINNPLAFQKEFKGDHLDATASKLLHTIILKDGYLSRYEGLLRKFDKKTTTFNVGETMTGIDSKGVVHEVKYSTISKRNSLEVTGVKSDFIYFSSIHAEKMVLITASDREANVLNFEVVSVGHKYAKQLLGKTIFIGLFNINETLCLTIPTEVLSRCTTKHLYIKDLNLFMTEPLVKVHLNKRQTSNGKHFEPFIKHTDVWTIKQ